MTYQEIENLKSLKVLLQRESTITYKAFQNLDFTQVEKYLSDKKFSNCLFLGCRLPNGFELKLGDCFIFPKLDMPYNCYVNRLYTKDDLYKGYQIGHPETYADTFDQKVYRHYIKTGKNAKDIKETLARRLHDHAMTDALDDFLSHYNEKNIVAFMGGHSLPRTDPSYKQIAFISKQLTEMGYLMTSGGGPGAMEATHLGAWFAGKPNQELSESIAFLSQAPTYKDTRWLDTAFEVLKQFPKTTYKSLGIPTWLYGHEPATPFATHIAKYFANSIREDGLLTIAKGGIIFAPGNAGTIQEVFQEATQNHYLSFGYASPMIFMDRYYWVEEKPIYPCLQRMLDEDKYKNLILSIQDDSDAIIHEIQQFTTA